MPYTPIPRGTLNWDVQLNAALSDLWAAASAATFYTLVAGAGAPSSVKSKAQYVCDGTNDQVEIQAAVDAAFAAGGGVVQLSANAFFTLAPITLHPTVRLLGTHGDQIFNTGQMTGSSYIRPVAGFAGGAAIVLLDQTDGGYSSKSAEQQIQSLTIDGTGVGGTVHGIQGGGYIHGVLLRDVTVKNVTGKGIYTFTANGSQPFSWNFHRVVVDNPDGVGIHLINHSDCTMTDVISIGAGDNAFTLSNMPNSRLLGVRAEWSEGHGYYITGGWGTGQGSGGMSMVGCSTDRNRFNGILVDATGNAPLIFAGISCRRDGRNGGAGGGDYSGFRVTAAGMPVIIDSLVNYPGVDDDGTGTNSPVNAFKASGSTYVAVNSGFLHGATNGFVDGGTNAVLRRGPNVGERTGTTAAPVNAFANPWGAAGNATFTGYTVVDAGQANGQWTTWDGTAKAFQIGTTGGGLAIKEGTNARMGVATLAAGTVVVPNTSVTASSRIFLTCEVPGGTPGFLRVSARTAGTSFTILSSSGTDTSTVGWVIFEPA
jgi:hypothetical protein